MTSTRLLCVRTNTSNPVLVPPPPAPPTKGYSAVQGATIDIPCDATSVDVQTCLSSGYFVLLGPVGPTSARPTYPRVGSNYVDATLGSYLTFDGTAWRDVTGASV